ncbi:MAG: hypothetical protein H7Z43_04275 [Clostridia bacterium]|nr:hypothetical protein [Deltaproteobacteria bacterium]
MRYGYMRPGICDCGQVTVTTATAAALDELRAQYADAACDAQTECVVGCEPAAPTGCSYHRDGNHSCDDSFDVCLDELLDPVRSSFNAFYDALANACDDVTDCLGINASVVRDDRYCLPGCPVGISLADATAFHAFVTTDATLTRQCESLFAEGCPVDAFSCFASAPDCVDHTCTMVHRDPALACSWTLTEPLSSTLEEYYASLTNYCDDVLDCTRIHSAITRGDNACWYGCGFAVSLSDAPALADFMADDVAVTSECQSIVDAECKVYAPSCAYEEVACVANKCSLASPL